MSGYWKKDKQGEESMTKEVFVPKETLKDVESYPYKAIPERGLRLETCELFGIKTAVSPSDGVTAIAHYFPYYSQKGELTGYKKRDLEVSKDDKYHFTTIGSVKIDNRLFGQNVAESNQRKHSKVFIVEGEYCAPSLYQALIDDNKGTAFADLKPFVVSIGLGTASCVENILHNKDFVLSFKDAIVLALDNDECTPAEKLKGMMKGREARDALGNALIGSPLFYLPFSVDKKDSSDYLQAGQSKELAKLAAFGAKPYVAEKILKASDVTLEAIIAERPLGVMVPEFPKLMNQIKGFRTRELTLLCAPTSVGKSTISSLFASAFMSAGEKVAMFYLEERPVETMQRMIASQLKVNYLEFKNSPLKVAKQEDIERVYNDIVSNNRIVMLDHFGSLPLSEFMSKIKHAYFVEGCRYIVVDHISILTSPDVANERAELDMTMTTLAAFCAANDVCVLLISHINRTNADAFKPPKGKENEPFWVRVTKESLRGSSSLESLSWNILALEPEILPDRSRGRCRIVTLKNRTWSYLGVADAFKLDQDTWEVILDEDSADSF
jgi:KaiC/GvpD/RAD55 family RecA-like ATPase